ncbi:class I SAM-dependent methyltransferase [Holzapfeliella sp. He02]|uniref:Class I SAM-dependent methyltransferase n=1 Tax=Holzapfeliella saturejae TaxID=3082953 RepID=A0ABU8SGH9_9LACO
MHSKRLEAIANLVNHNQKLADIGTDHAYLPIDLVEKGVISSAIAADIAEGPLNNAVENIQQHQLADKISTRLGNGLVPFSKADEVEQVVIAGMGGKLIVDILEEASQRQLYFETLILEPNIGEEEVRQWLMTHHYQITEETIVKEGRHIYEIIKAVQVNQKVTYSEAELLFGPVLVQEKPELFIQKWQHKLDTLTTILRQLKQHADNNQEKIEEFENTVRLIEQEVL